MAATDGTATRDRTYNFTNPESTIGGVRCAADARTIDTGTITTQVAPNIPVTVTLGYLNLRYNPICRTIWARVALTASYADRTVVDMVAVVRNDGVSTSASSWFNSGLTYWSRQLNDKYFTAYARGTLYNQ
ncbi:MAG: DUF2690 domain-containing protein, partial [Dactylosporangium sp.]|nr:DUF2690 domain-containing protein [Dactylosporangium sp.]NNJ61487.1 DUF2690 domain-containing protein [Dactylosporangium sp.]